jgi:hypothetical protein
MINREVLNNMGYEHSIVFENPDYDDAIIGVSHDDRVIYDYDKMLEHLMAHEDMTDEEAADFISYNTIRSIPYAGENAPIVMYGIN